jgi:ABC-2 type transport system permease protein
MILHTLRYELLAISRNKRARIFTIGFPVLLLVILSGLGGNAMTTFDGAPVTLERFFLPGILAMTLITACFAALVQIVVTRRQLGVYKRRRATPVPAIALVGAQTIATTIVGIASAAVLLIVGRAAFDIGISLGALVAVFVTFVIGSLALCAIAFAVAAVIPSPETAQPVVQFVMFPLLFISGIWFTSDDMPGWLNTVADLFPVAHLSAALHQGIEASSFGDAIAPGHLAVVALWGVVAAVFAARRFSWMPSTASS